MTVAGSITPIKILFTLKLLNEKNLNDNNRILCDGQW